MVGWSTKHSWPCWVLRDTNNARDVRHRCIYHVLILISLHYIFIIPLTYICSSWLRMCSWSRVEQNDSMLCDPGYFHNARAASSSQACINRPRWCRFLVPDLAEDAEGCFSEMSSLQALTSKSGFGHTSIQRWPETARKWSAWHCVPSHFTRGYNSYMRSPPCSDNHCSGLERWIPQEDSQAPCIRQIY